jgi:chemotaxis response regulator CheB
MEELKIVDPVTNETRVYVVITREDGSKLTIEATETNPEFVAITTEMKEEENG